MGIPELEAKRYEGKVKKGNILISVHTEDSDEIDQAKDIFEEAGDAFSQSRTTRCDRPRCFRCGSSC